MNAAAHSEVRAALLRMNLLEAAAPLRLTRLEGGVSSDVWRAELPDRTICIKRALPKLRVPQDWFAPIERNVFEYRWLETLRDRAPGLAPARSRATRTAG